MFRYCDYLQIAKAKYSRFKLQIQLTDISQNIFEVETREKEVNYVLL